MESSYRWGIVAVGALMYRRDVLAGASHNNVAAYFGRLKARPSHARVLREAEPYFSMFPKEASA
jgi:glutathione S-transferase